MDKKHKVSVPEPCHENWNKMIPKDNGRFCLTCTKTVVDFTKMSTDEIQNYFISNQNKSICGRFKDTQLDELTIQIPRHIVYSQTRYNKIFLLALFIAMGTSLFSCTDKDGKKQKINKVEVIEDKSSKTHTTVGIILPPKNSSQHVLPPPPRRVRVDQVKFIKPIENTNNKKAENKKDTSFGAKNEEKSNSKNKSSKKELKAKTETVTNKNADLPGGIEQFYTFFEKEYKRPENTSKLKIKITFAVEKNGSVSYIESEPAIDKTIEKEIIRVLSLCPKWQPGESNGKKIRMQYSLPIVLQ